MMIKPNHLIATASALAWVVGFSNWSPSIASAQVDAAAHVNKADLDAQRSTADRATIESNDNRLSVFLGQAKVIHLPFAVKRVAIGDQNIADFRLISPSELYLQGKHVGRTNILIWDRFGASQSATIDVDIDLQALDASIRSNLPAGNQINVTATASSIILNGTAADTVAANAALRLTRAYAQSLESALAQGSAATGTAVDAGQAAPAASSGSDTVQVVNLMKIRAPQQVMLEVRIAEISKSIVDRLGMKVEVANPGGSLNWSVGSNFLGSGGGVASVLFGSHGTNYRANLDAERKRGTIKILAEPTIVAMSGEEGKFLVGGKIFIPIAQNGSGSGTNFTLEERQFGVGLTFLPTVLDNGRINLRVAPEVSELSKEPIALTSGQSSTLLPSFTTSTVSTTVQLRDGQSLVIGGLLRNSIVKTLKGFPLLSQIPILGALFSSDDFASDRTELIVVVRPTLVAGTDVMPALPTDELRGDLRLPAPVPAPTTNPQTEQQQ